MNREKMLEIIDQLKALAWIIEQTAIEAII